METLRLEDLLPFLNARSDWTLCCKNGKYSLRFGRKKFKFKGVTAAASRGRGRRGGTANMTGQKRAAAGDDFMRAKWLREIRTAVDTPRDSTCGGDDEGGVEGEEDEEDTLNEDDQAAAGGRLRRDGGAASCDSLFWDDYGVKPQVENPTLEEQDMLGHDASERSSSPDNLRDGLVLLREMIDLRREIRKIADTSSVIPPAMPVKPQKALKAVNSEELRQYREAICGGQNEQMREAGKEDMWDSGCIDDESESAAEEKEKLAAGLSTTPLNEQAKNSSGEVCCATTAASSSNDDKGDLTAAESTPEERESLKIVEESKNVGDDTDDGGDGGKAAVVVDDVAVVTPSVTSDLSVEAKDNIDECEGGGRRQARNPQQQPPPSSGSISGQQGGQQSPKAVSKSRRRRDKKQQRRSVLQRNRRAREKGEEGEEDEDDDVESDDESSQNIQNKKPSSTHSRREMVWRNASREIEAAARVDPVLDFLWRELKGVPAPDGDERLKESARKILANSFGSSFRWMKSPEYHRVVYRSPFEWEFVALNGDYDTYNNVMSRKRMRQFRCSN